MFKFQSLNSHVTIDVPSPLSITLIGSYLQLLTRYVKSVGISTHTLKSVIPVKSSNPIENDGFTFIFANSFSALTGDSLELPVILIDNPAMKKPSPSLGGVPFRDNPVPDSLIIATL